MIRRNAGAFHSRLYKWFGASVKGVIGPGMTIFGVDRRPRKELVIEYCTRTKKETPGLLKKPRETGLESPLGEECRNFGVGVSFFSRVGTVRNAVRWGGDEWNSTMAMMRERFEGHRLKEPPGPAVRWSCYIVVLSRQRRGGRPPYLNCSRLGHKTWKRGDDPAILRTR